MNVMQRATWRDTLVDIFAISVMFSAVFLRFWDMRSAAPWMVAVVAGRWGATSMAKIAIARSVAAQPLPPVRAVRAPSDPPPPAIVEDAKGAVEEIKAKPPLPSSAIVLVFVVIGAGILHWVRHTFRV